MWVKALKVLLKRGKARKIVSLKAKSKGARLIANQPSSHRGKWKPRPGVGVGEMTLWLKKKGADSFRSQKSSTTKIMEYQTKQASDSIGTNLRGCE